MQNSKGKNASQKLKVWLFGLFLIIFSISSLSLPSFVLAHETQSNNGIGAILHVDPGDAPIAGQDSTLFFEFTDMEGKLDLNNCKCSVVISRDGQEVLSQEFTGIPGTEGTSGMIDFIFPEPGIYKTLVTGIPKEEGQFKSFKLNFSTRVEKDFIGTVTEDHSKPHNTLFDHVKHYSLVGLAIALLGTTLITIRHKKNLAVILLCLVLVSHLLPIKAIHASHGEVLDLHGYECCIPASAALPVIDSEIETPGIERFVNNKSEHEQILENYIYLSSRSPPQF